MALCILLQYEGLRCFLYTYFINKNRICDKLSQTPALPFFPPVNLIYVIHKLFTLIFLHFMWLYTKWNPPIYLAIYQQIKYLPNNHLTILKFSFFLIICILIAWLCASMEGCRELKRNFLKTVVPKHFGALDNVVYSI